MTLKQRTNAHLRPFWNICYARLCSLAPTRRSKSVGRLGLRKCCPPVCSFESHPDFCIIYLGTSAAFVNTRAACKNSVLFRHVPRNSARSACETRLITRCNSAACDNKFIFLFRRRVRPRLFFSPPTPVQRVRFLLPVPRETCLSS